MTDKAEEAEEAEAAKQAGSRALGADRPGLAVDYVERARRLALRIGALGDRIEQERRLPEELLAALIDAGMFRLVVPLSLGGAQLDPMTYVAVIEEIAKADASTAWCLGQASGCSLVSAYLPPEVVREIFAGERQAILAWGPGPNARAVAVEGGYRVTGTWSFASGGRHANWLGGHSPIVEPDGTPRRHPDGTPVVRTMLFPAAGAEMADVWHVIGLRGTASDSFTVTDLFVPHERSVAREGLTERRLGDPLYAFGTNSLFAAGFGGVALGIARGMLDAFIDLAREKTPRGLKRTLRDGAVTQSEVAQAEARLLSARLFLMASLEEIWRTLAPWDDLTVEQRMRIRLASTHAIQQAMGVVDFAYHAAGATAIFASNAFERRFRDMHAAAQQLQGRRAHFETVGQFLLGLEPDLTFS